MIKRNETSITKNTLVSVSNSYSDPYCISDYNITIAWKLADFFGNNIAAEPKYGSFKLR